MRIDKYLAHAGVGSRKEVKKFIKDKRVTLNGTFVSCISVVCYSGTHNIFQPENHKLLYPDFSIHNIGSGM